MTDTANEQHGGENPHESEDDSIYMRFGDVEFSYEGDDLKTAWENAKAGIDAYMEAAGYE